VSRTTDKAIDSLNARALPANVIKCMRPEDRKALNVQAPAELAQAYEAATEREIQRTVEAWLRQRGYYPRTPEFLDGKDMPDQRGWQVHLHETKRNPILLDLLVIGLDGRCIEVELKTATGGIRAEQHAILHAGGRVYLARSAAEAIGILTEWDNAFNMN
jgi:hypothetical protein